MKQVFLADMGEVVYRGYRSLDDNPWSNFYLLVFKGKKSRRIGYFDSVSLMSRFVWEVSWNEGDIESVVREWMASGKICRS